ncbi:efflux RND transporter permease subunit [Pedobacter sp. ISL-68]|uniref:efflux RND transporter permease subunit n=1 Tax=unclassified Pedobacter TaxID=2628915 RepID=UPI001BE95D57|nr:MULTISPECIES: efflux RND transporter permease subunit [unclassified Pedobacter]MBT2561851.1 efflux RND transporter permease subunit [Pedobacter sp. ISL-64]MBT2592509.1 efflux RND transporter permease subunit [Pedobacter sp. ISL-68]
MSISTTGIKKVAFIAVANMVFGLVSCKQTPKERAVMQVYVSYAKADSTTVMKILDPLQKEISKISNIHKISTSSQKGAGNIIVEFNIDKNIDSAAIEVQNRLTVANTGLPKEAKIYCFRMNNEHKKNKYNQ